MSKNDIICYKNCMPRPHHRTTRDWTTREIPTAGIFKAQIGHNPFWSLGIHLWLYPTCQLGFDTYKDGNLISKDYSYLYQVKGLPRGHRVKEPADSGSIPGSGRCAGEGMATHSSTLAWKISWTEEPGGLQSMGLQRVRYNWATLLYFTHTYPLEGLK